MSTPVKLAGFLAAVAAIVGLAVVATAHDTTHGDETAQASHYEGGRGGVDQDPSTAQEIPGGLMVSQNGYTLALAEPRAQARQDRRLSFTITGPDGAPVTEYDVEHEKDLHLIAVRRDFSGFQHVHPVLDEDTGVWATDLDLTRERGDSSPTSRPPAPTR